jgi:hypothetical protein
MLALDLRKTSLEVIMNLNNYLPDYFLREVHHMAVQGSAADIYQSICNFDMSSVSWIKNLFRLRTALDKTKSKAGHLTLHDAYKNGGFILLEEIPDRELTVGAVGKIWKPAISFTKLDSSEYADFHKPGFAKVAWSLRCEPRFTGGTFCSFEVRVGATDSVSAGKMRGYYSLIGPFSRAIRHSVFGHFEKEFGNLLSDEATRMLPGDSLIDHPEVNMTHGIFIEAPPEAIWPWILQMGCLRAGWYSYDWLDNAGVSSSNRIVPEWQNIHEGDFINWTPQNDQDCCVVSIDPYKSFVLGACFDHDRNEALAPNIDPLPSNYSRTTWQFVLEPQTNGITRLIVRARADYDFKKQIILQLRTLVMKSAHSFMERKQLQNLKSRAENMGFASV